MRIGAWALLAAVMACRTAMPAKAPELTPRLATTAGGTWVTISNVTFALKTPQVEIGMRDRRGREVIAWFPAEGVKKMDAATLQFQTPRFIEACADVRISDGGREVILPQALCYRTLAYTANQVSQDLNVIDTADNGLFSEKSAMPFPFPIVPSSLALSKTIQPGRELYIVDSHSGNLHIYDASNLQYYGMIELQTQSFSTWGAAEIAVGHDGIHGYVLHISDHDFVCPAYPCEPSGSISVVDLQAKVLVDIDDDPSTTSNNAPDRITRIEFPQVPGLLPLTAEDIYLPRQTTTYEIGEKYPGEYLFVSGAGILAREDVPLYGCSPGVPCLAAELPVSREFYVAVVDLNPSYVYAINPDKTLDLRENGEQWKVVRMIRIGHQSGDLFEESRGLDFSVASEQGERNAYIYAVSPSNNTVVVIDFQTLDVAMNEEGQPIILSTGPNPTDVKVQRVPDLDNPGSYLTRAYITNAGDDTVTVVNTATNGVTATFGFGYASCALPDARQFTAIDTRSKGEFGYTADFNAGTVSVINLPQNDANFGGVCTIDVGEAPIRIVVQPVPGYETFFGMVRNELAFAQPTDFTNPSKQSNLIRDWEDVDQLQETSATPQAVLANISAFQTKVGNWVTNAPLKKSLDEGVNLYRSAYIYDHPTQ